MTNVHGHPRLISHVLLNQLQCPVRGAQAPMDFVDDDLGALVSEATTRKAHPKFHQLATKHVSLCWSISVKRHENATFTNTSSTTSTTSTSINIGTSISVKGIQPDELCDGARFPPEWLTEVAIHHEVDESMGSIGQNCFNQHDVVISRLLRPCHDPIHQLSLCPSHSQSLMGPSLQCCADPCLHLSFGAPHQQVSEEETHQQISSDTKTVA